MKTVRFKQWGALACVGALLVTPLLAQDKATDKKAGDAKGGAAPDMAEMMKKMTELGAPGPEHKALDALSGEWLVNAKFFMAGPDAPATESKGTSSKHWVLGGRFLQEDYKGDFMGMPFQGMGLTGFDKMKKKYVSSWIDNMGTALYTSEGSVDAGNKVFTLTGTMDDPMTGEKNKPTKYVLRIVSADKHVMEMHDLALGDKSKVGEMTYTRK